MNKTSKNNTLTKTICQYSEPLPKDTMEFLKGIAIDYCKVKNYTYKRFSGIKSLNRLTPVYSILNEMRYCGLREQLNLPVVYYELAIADAVTDIKARWGTVKNKVGELITANENLSNDDRIYLRTVLKMNSVYTAILNHQEYEIPKNAVNLNIDVKHIVCRVPRKRICLPLRDNRIFHRQIQIHIRENYAVLTVPVETKVRKHNDYINMICVYIGYKDLFTLSSGKIYGEGLGEILDPETERLMKKNSERQKIQLIYQQLMENGNLLKADQVHLNNLGKYKYDKQKERERSKTITFINSEINRMLKEEKPQKVIITKPVTKNKTMQYSKMENRKLTRNFRSYIRERLAYKCQLNSIELIEINSKGTGKICSSCGVEGKREGMEFICENCGMRISIPLNSAKNIENKYNKG